MSDDIGGEIDLTPTRNPGIQVNPSQNVKGEVDPHAHEVNVEIQYLHPDLTSLDKVIDAANYQRRVARHPYDGSTGRIIYTALLYWEKVLIGSEDPIEQQYLINVQELLHHHKKQIAFQDELITLINKHSQNDESGTPDHLLADYLIRCLQTWNLACIARDKGRIE